jgi:uncharacterized membrane protein YbhN (UPF0104 family)
MDAEMKTWFKKWRLLIRSIVIGCVMVSLAGSCVWGIIESIEKQHWVSLFLLVIMSIFSVMGNFVIWYAVVDIANKHDGKLSY